MMRFLAFVLSAFMLLTSCEQPIIGDGDSGADGDTRKVTLHISGYTMIPFSSPSKAARSESVTRASSVPSVTHIDLAVFDADGNKITKVNQKIESEAFGSPVVSLADGTYTLVVIAHSGSGVATITSPEEVAFPNNKVTDTFYACQQIVVSEAATSHDITLVRPVAMVRVILTDTSLPDGFAQLQLYYTGGSSTFSPSTGYGSKNSRQTELRNVADASRDAEGRYVFEVYTFPHDEQGTLKLTLTPLDSKGSEVSASKVVEAVPVRINYITEAYGTLFSSGTSSSIVESSMAFNIDDVWSGTTSVEF